MENKMGGAEISWVYLEDRKKKTKQKPEQNYPLSLYTDSLLLSKMEKQHVGMFNFIVYWNSLYLKCCL